MDKIRQLLKELKKIEPDRDYSRTSKIAILNYSRPEEKSGRFLMEIIRFAAAAAAGILLIITALGGASYFNEKYSPLNMEGLNQKNLVSEAKDINDSIKITLEEIKYLDQSNKKAINAMNELSKNKPNASSLSATASSSLNATSTEDLNNFLINPSVAPSAATSTEINGTSTNFQDVNALLEKISQ